MFKKLSASVLAIGMVFLGVPAPGWAEDLIAGGDLSIIPQLNGTDGTLEDVVTSLAITENTIAENLTVTEPEPAGTTVEPSTETSDPMATEVVSATGEPAVEEAVAVGGITTETVAEPVAIMVSAIQQEQVAVAAPPPGSIQTEYFVNRVDGLVRSITQIRRFPGGAREEIEYFLSGNDSGLQMTLNGENYCISLSHVAYYDQNNRIVTESNSGYGSVGIWFLQIFTWEDVNGAWVRRETFRWIVGSSALSDVVGQ